MVPTEIDAHDVERAEARMQAEREAGYAVAAGMAAQRQRQEASARHELQHTWGKGKVSP